MFLIPVKKSSKTPMASCIELFLVTSILASLKTYSLTSFWIVLDVDGNGDVEVGGDGNGNGGGDNNGDNEAQGDLESKNEDEGVDEGEDVSEGECDGDKNFKGDFFGDDDDDTCGDRADCVHVDINGAESAAGNGESDDVTTLWNSQM